MTAALQYLQEHPTPLHPPSWIFSPWLWVPLMLQHGLVFKLLYGPDRPFEVRTLCGPLLVVYHSYRNQRGVHNRSLCELFATGSTACSLEPEPHNDIVLSTASRFR